MSDNHNIHIMVLDDEPFMLKLLGRMLTGLGYAHVTHHERGSDALNALDAPDGMPSLILLDINMPGMDGVEFVRHLSERHYEGGLILVSAMDELMQRATAKLAQAHKLKVIGVLHKPPMPMDLAALLAKCMPGKTANPGRERKTYDVDRIKTAITDGELVNYYQPKVLVATGALVGVETLVRWQHPEDGLVFPDQFIPVVEAYGLTSDLTNMVLTDALRQVRAWRDAGIQINVSINVSMDDLADLDFADAVVAKIMAAGVPPETVELEVTESRLMQRQTTVLDVLARLRLRHVRLSIDDFGTGHSSLVQLRDLPFDELKIDRSFTHRAGHDSRLKAIFEASLDLANYLGMTVVAEGVEDADDWAFLRAAGSHIAQGYFIAHPMPADQFPAWVAEWQARIHPLEI